MQKFPRLKSHLDSFNLKPQNFKAVLWGFILLGAFLLLTILETWRLFLVVDPVVTELLQMVTPTFLNLPLSFFSLLGSFEITTLILLIVVVLEYRKNKTILFSLILFGMILVFEMIGKFFLLHGGPPQEFFRYTLPFSFPTSYVQTGYSFPSGHVSRTIFLAVIGIFLLRKKVLLIVIIILTSLAMVYSRIYLGEHWFSDTLGGVLLGGSMGLLSSCYFPHEDRK